MSLVPKLLPPSTKPHASVARIEAAWYVACLARELKSKPMARTILGVPLVLFRGRGEDGEPTVGAMVDRCPHRNVPLSLGKTVDGSLQCAYHGWQFGPAGECRLIPGLLRDEAGAAAARAASAYPAQEQDGFIWVWMSRDEEPTAGPFRPAHIGEDKYTTIRRVVDVQATVHATVENALDVPHTAFLHSGYFRGKGEPNEIEVVVRRTVDGVEAEYIGEPRPEGLAGKIIAPGGGVVEHYDRFLLPSVAQVEYRLGDKTHFLVSSLCTPIQDFHTRMFAVVSFKMPLPGWLVRLFLQPVAMKIFRQDAAILKRQTEVIQQFGGERYVSTPLDLLGGHIWRILKAAERGETVQPLEERTAFRA